ncbi:MAG: sigma-70 family RNA polymerase sigma factor [Spirosomataceae bacterium]
MYEINQLTDHLFRHESGKMVAVLTRLFGFPNYDLARDLVQDTLLAALSHWKLHGVPDNPTAWLYAVAKNKALDYLRQQQRHEVHRLAYEATEQEATFSEVDRLFLEHEVEDSVLRMMFACCHPSLPTEAQIALILRTLCGLSIGEIARAFLSNEETIQKRLYRTKEKIRSATILLEVPTGNELTKRLDGVLKAIYLLFNEGYNSQLSDLLIRQDLCLEAMRLAELLSNHAHTNQPQVNALVALLYFQASRLEARLDATNQIVLLEHQNRNLWNRGYIKKGEEYLDKASEGSHLSEYHLQAGIAYYHASAPSFEQTNWKAIAYLYHLLIQMNPSPTVQLNRAIAIGFSESPQRGIEVLQNLTGLEKNHYYHAALGDFYVKSKQIEAAKIAYQQALQFCVSNAERALIEGKIVNLSSQLNELT